MFEVAGGTSELRGGIAAPGARPLRGRQHLRRRGRRHEARDPARGPGGVGVRLRGGRCQG